MAPSPRPAALHRDTRRGLVGGVLAGLGERIGLDPIVLRVGFVIAAIATGGLALPAYLVAWAALPDAEGSSRPLIAGRRLPRVRGNWRVAAGVGLLTLSGLLVFRQLGIWWSDALGWAIVLAAFGAAVLWGHSRAPRPDRAPSRRSTTPREPGTAAGESQSGPAGLYRGGVGVLLVVGAALLFLSSNHILGGLRDAALTAVVVVVAVALILAPFLWRLGRNLADERAERIRSQERAEVATHLHDSVLQTLTLMQKRA